MLRRICLRICGALLFEDPELLRVRGVDGEPAPAEAKDGDIPGGNNRSKSAERLGRAIAEQKAKLTRAGGEYQKREFRTKWAAGKRRGV